MEGGKRTKDEIVIDKFMKKIQRKGSKTEKKNVKETREETRLEKKKKKRRFGEYKPNFSGNRPAGSGMQ